MLASLLLDVILLPTDGCLYAKALYPYEAVGEEELAFQEGQLIKIIRKEINGIDDGWWEGEANGKTGVFPSLVVEEINPVNGQVGDMTFFLGIFGEFCIFCYVF